MKFPTFLTVALLAILVALSVSTVSADNHRTGDDRDVDRDRDRTEQTTPDEPEDTDRDRGEDNDEAPRGNVVYDKNGVVVRVDEGSDEITVTVVVNGDVASKVTYSGDFEDYEDNSGEDSSGGEDGEDGQDGEDNNGDGEDDSDEEDGGRDTDRDRDRDTDRSR